MGRFDGILLLSDWDGTFCNGGEIPAANIDAVNYFEENGGLFGFSSGRNYTHLQSYFGAFRPNTYSCCYNGALIISADGTETVYQNLSDGSILDALDRAILLCPSAESVWLDFIEEEGGHLHLPMGEYLSDKEKYRSKTYYKAIAVCGSAEEAEAAELALRQAEEKSPLGYDAVRSWSTGLEILKSGNNKGAAIRRIKEITGAKLSIGVGDYMNDALLLREADIGYAVASGRQELISLADRVTCSCAQGAIAGMIEDLKKEY